LPGFLRRSPAGAVPFAGSAALDLGEPAGEDRTSVATMPKPDEETEALQKELLSLAEKCREAQRAAVDTQDFGPATPLPKVKPATRRVLKGHINKVTCCHFSGMALIA